eukprot:CAMPEP_0185766718 /NCGR_PEP_ID=MMETSP1174-20130828/38608_1 /TAXON_ID=35687 /ORGANISM="Dictyocha speculum, Strain CCMP1381" /LENGTH=307 /DNA_ID=CAMNT_0028450521 /DNA_START=137 /DNA_END=1060 /DNA_ORIENTATION=+
MRGIHSKVSENPRRGIFGFRKQSVVRKAAGDVVLDVEYEVKGEGDGEITAPGKLSRMFEVLKILGNTSLILQILMIFVGNRNAKLGPYLLPLGHELHKYVWTLLATSYVWDVLGVAAKRGRLDDSTFRLINISMLASIALLIGSGSAIPYTILAIIAIPSALALRSCSFRGLLQPMRLFGTGNEVPTIAVVYGMLAWEALFSVFQSPGSLPLLRAAIFYRLHFATLEERLEDETYTKLNDSLFYTAFSMFPSMACGITPAFVVPGATAIVGIMKGTSSTKQYQKKREKEAEDAAKEAAEDGSMKTTS